VYTSQQNEETRVEVMQAHIRAHSLGVWVALGDGELIANHIPFDLDASRGEFGVLIGHVARANPVWRQLPAAVPSMVVFQGPQSYITPSWYPSKHEHGKAVPTWNYVVVHAHGVPRFIQDKAWLREHVSRLTDRHEASRALPWAVSDAPEDYLEKMLGAIVGLEIPITRLEGKWKMSQNRSESDQLGVLAGLLGARNAQASGVAEVMRANLQSRPMPG
jgi:transcriptional regulator